MISVRPITSTDAAAVAAAVDQSRDALRRWMPWYRDDYDVASAQLWIDASLAAAASGSAQQFAIVDDDGSLIGLIGLEDFDNESGRAMIGYWLSTPATGRHVARQAVDQVLNWARTRPGLHTVWAFVADANGASRRVLEVNQFGLVGTRGINERGDTLLLYELELHPERA